MTADSALLSHPCRSSRAARTRRGRCCAVRSRRALVKESVDAPRGFRADAVDLHQIGDRSALDRLERAEMMQQSPLARRPDAGDLLQSGLAQTAHAPRPVRADGEAMRLVAQPF